jgi:hypothetical protein
MHEWDDSYRLKVVNLSNLSMNRYKSLQFNAVLLISDQFNTLSAINPILILENWSKIAVIAILNRY